MIKLKRTLPAALTLAILLLTVSCKERHNWVDTDSISWDVVKINDTTLLVTPRTSDNVKPFLLKLSDAKDVQQIESADIPTE